MHGKCRFLNKTKIEYQFLKDCNRDYDRETYSAHTQCVTELERYSGKDYVPKANQNKGLRKQEAWVDLVRSITEKNKSLSQGVKKILETISAHDNIPRKVI